MKEVFKDVPGYEGHYQISNKGILRSIPRTIIRRDGFSRRVGEKLMTPTIMKWTDPIYGKAYETPTFCMRKDLKTEMIPAVHLVLGAFYPEYEIGTYKVKYKDGDRTNVSLSNLKIDFWKGREGGYVELSKKGRKTQKFRSLAQAGSTLKFDHTRIFDKEYESKNAKGYTISFTKKFKRKGKSVSKVTL